MKLNHIKTFLFTPKAKTQIILGTNGSGKSSLIYELSPLPALHRNYAVGGKKIIKIEHNNSFFELTSNFEKGQAHSFIKDGVELNPGVGTYTVQLDLVQKHFGITPKIHELALGQRRFHQMSVSERREWFTQLSDSNYDYAISVYNRLKEKLRDVSGAIKIAKKNLSIETNKVFSDEDMKTLETKCQSLYDLVVTLQEHRMPEEIRLDDLEQTRLELRSEIEDKNSKVRSLLRNIYPHVDSAATLNEQIEHLSNENKRCDLLSSQFYQDHLKINDQFKTAQKVRQQSLEELKQEIQQLQDKKAELRNSYKLKLPEVAEPLQAAAQVESIHHWLGMILDVLQEYKNKNIDIETKNSMVVTLQTTKEMLERDRYSVQKYNGVLNHLNGLKNKEKIECPNCHHQWIYGFDQTLYDNTNQNVENLNIQIAENIKKRDTLEEDINSVNQYLQAREQFANMVRSNQLMDHFWDYILKENILETNPGNIPYLLSLYTIDLETQHEIINLNDQVKKKNALIEQMLENNGLDYEYILRTKEELETKIVELQDKKRDTSKRLKSAQALFSDIQVLREASEQLKALVSDYEHHGDTMMETYRRKVYNEMLRAVQSQLAKLEDQLQEAKNFQKTIRDIEEQIVALERDERCLKALVKELSPTEGLIAEGLFGFSRLFIQQMNHFIKRIWTYPLVVQPCKLGADGVLDLDYKFPVVVDTADNVCKDISEGSSAMQEVIDLAFKITAMKALKLDNYPLFLDEFGSTMDPAHKAATIQLINSIMEQDHFTQLFMISHDAIQYGALSNTEVTVISADNMLLPKDAVYNQNVLINA